MEEAWTTGMNHPGGDTLFHVSFLRRLDTVTHVCVAKRNFPPVHVGGPGPARDRGEASSRFCSQGDVPPRARHLTEGGQKSVLSIRSVTCFGGAPLEKICTANYYLHAKLHHINRCTLLHTAT